MLQITSPGIEQTFNKALALHRAGDLPAADQLYVQVLLANPQHAEAWRWRGILAAQAGQTQAGLDMIRQAIALRKFFPEAWNDLGGALLHTGHKTEAVAAYQKAVEESPTFVEAWNNLGIAFARSGDHVAAQSAFEKAIFLAPDFFDSYNGVGMALRDQGKVDEAMRFFEQAIERKADHPEMLNNLGNCYKALGSYEDSIATYQRAIAARPKFVEVYNNMANAYKDLGRMDEAIDIYRQAIAIAPTWAEIYNNLANALKDSGRMEEAMAMYQEALRLRPGLTPAHSNLIYVRQFLHEVNPAEDLREAQRWDEVQAGPARADIRPHVNDRNPERRLRVGYISPDFRTHSVAYFMESLLQHHDPEQVETFCYSDVLKEDAITQRLRAKTHQWRNILAVSDAKVADMIRADKIDILVDLSGHTAGNRLLTFARKPAPVQVSYLGYSGTTGLRAIDYRLTDVHADPSELGEEKFYSENLVRLPQSFISFRPDDASPPVAPLPLGKNSFVTFGSFNALPKLTAEMLAAWCRILCTCPNSRFLLKARGLSDHGVRTRMEKKFADHGITADRIELVEKVTSLEEHLAYYGRIDVALDTFPYHGTTTTCEALWMGVPVVTLAGNVHRSRVGVSILTSVGLPELIAKDLAEFERIAIELAGNAAKLSDLRKGLRERMNASPLMDAANHVCEMEKAYRIMWRRWCETNHA